nr:hypothetical protein [Allomuricauda sp.]
MEDYTVQIAEFEYPFPSQLLEQQLTEAGVAFRSFNSSATEAGIMGKVYFVKSTDASKAFEIREKIDSENAKAEIRHMHPYRKILAYVSLILILLYVIYSAIGFINDLNN